MAKTTSGSSPKFRELEVGNFGAKSWPFYWVFFGIFEQFLAKLHPVAHQNVTFSTLGWCMSGWCPAQVLDFKQISLAPPEELDIKQNQMSWPILQGSSHLTHLLADASY